jgi:hypothetical protein
MVAFAPDGSRLVQRTPEGVATFYSLPSGRQTTRFERVGSFLAFERDGLFLIEGDEGMLYVRDGKTGRRLRLVAQEPDVRRNSFTAVPAPDGRLLVSRPLAFDEHWYTSRQQSLREAYTGKQLVQSAFTRSALSPDGRTLVTADYFVPGELIFRETASLEEIGRLPTGHRGDITALAFSPDGRWLATGSSDTSILLWDWQSAAGASASVGPTPSLPELWQNLSGDARTAHRAMGNLTASGDRAMAFLRDRLRPVTEADCQPIRRRLKELDSEDYRTRQSAMDALSSLYADWLPFLDQALLAKPSLEASRALEKALGDPHKLRWSPQMLRGLRAVQMLERIGTPEATQLLQHLSKGQPWSRLTQDAQDALQRLRGLSHQ